MFKRIISGLLIMSMLLSMNIPVFAVDGDNDNNNILEIEMVEFEKTGLVTTLINNYDKEYFIVTEEIGRDGTYSGPKIEKSITKEQFDKYYNGKAYDKLSINVIANNDNSPLYANFVFDNNDQIINKSYVGDVVDGNFSPISVDTTDNVYTWLYVENENYYSVSTNKTTQTSVYTPITALEYDKMLFNKNFLYSKITSDKKTDTETVRTEVVLDVDGNVVGTPIVVNVDKDGNVAEIAYVLNDVSGGTISGLSAIERTIEKYGPQEAPAPQEPPTEQPTPQTPPTENPTPETPQQVPPIGPEVEEIYRVRKSWDDEASQQGAYYSRDAAIKKAEEVKMNVYDWNGNLVYEYEEEEEEPVQPPVQPPREEPQPPAPNNNQNNNQNNNNQSNQNNDIPDVNRPQDEDAIIGEKEEEEDRYTLDEEMLAKYSGLYSNWMDEYNRGYHGFWLDPYFNGSLAIIEWVDPFWSQSDINQSAEGNEIASGYYDDAGNYIPLDKNGNPIPSEPGTFDSAGNFMPENSTGYYDPDGVYHPLFETIPGIRYEFDGSFHIDGQGYFDADGVWHAEENDNYRIILFDGRIVYKNGYMENPVTGVRIKIDKDIWGNYYYGDEVIYSDFSVYNKKDNTLALADGTIYEGKTEGVYTLFGNNDAVVKGTFEKGKKTITGVMLNNGGNITDSGVVQYPNGISYTEGIGISLPNGEILNESFTGKEYIELVDYGRIYPNGHIAVYNEYGDLTTDMDAIIYDDRILLDNGDIFKDGVIYNTYRDKNGNLIIPDGFVISTNLELGAYARNGSFVADTAPEEDGYYDRLGNLINSKGAVKTSDNKIGYYDSVGKFIEGVITNTAYYYTADGTKVFADGSVDKNEKLFGYYDKNKNFVMNDGGGFFDEDGTFSQASDKQYYKVSNTGLFYSELNSKFALNIDGSISVMGELGTYDENGMVELKGDLGYYDETGVFIISKENPYIQFGYFYDSLQNKHNIGAIYKDESGALKLLQNPQFGLNIHEGKIKMSNSDLLYTEDGLVTVDGKTGYFTDAAKFVESKKSPYIGGFYDQNGFWVDRTYYTDVFGNLSINYGGFNYMGNYVTPSGDIGCFDSLGTFNLNKTNVMNGQFYDNNGVLRTVDGFYIDEFGLYKNINGKEAFGYDGSKINLKDSVGMKIGDYVMIEYGMFISPDGEIGHFNKDGEFLAGRSKYQKGFYTPSGGFVYYGNTDEASKATNFIYILNKFYVVYNGGSTASGILTMYDGYSIPVEILQSGKYFKISDKIVISDTGKVGYWENNNFVEGRKDIEKKIISTQFTNYIDLSDEYGYFTSDGTFILYDGGYGYYNEDGTLIIDALNPYSNGFYTFDGVWKQTNTFSEIPNKGYFNKYGIKRNGENPYNIGFYDYEGSLHPYDKNYFITESGNVIEAGEHGIGYIDNKGNFYLYEKDGYFNADGSYYIDTVLQGYYDADGVLNRGKNPNFDGFYDMLGNWHMFGDKGYYDPSGYYYEDVTDSTIGFFNEVGEFTEGYNPYINGYNDINGNWSDSFTMPLTTYYEKDGTVRVGNTPYKDGYFDMYANWHRYRDKGYFDKHGTYYSLSNAVAGYYDARGNYLEGTNPYQHGYYDEDGNLRLFEHDGYFTKNGSFVDEKGIWYFLAGGLKKKGENPNADGFYDKYGNYYPFDEEGYYTPNGLFFPTLLVVDKYRVGSSNYILFEGTFLNPEFVSVASKNTIQFTFNGDSGAPLFVDTGIKVSKNAMISYSKARDLLHNIAVYSRSTFIEDNDSCIVIVDGKIVNLTNNGKMSINELRNKFLDSNISIAVARTRIGQKFALADSIEAGRNIKILHNGNKYNINNPLVVSNGSPYISLKDISELIAYNVRVQTEDGRKVVTFTLKDNVSSSMKDSLPDSISVEIGKTETLVNVTENKYTYYILKAPLITRTLGSTGLEEVYVPIYMLGNLTGTSVEYNTMTYVLELYADDRELPFEDN